MRRQASRRCWRRFLTYGLGYKYGGWHLTRTVVVGGDGKIYVAVGSSCNACEEKEEVRASILQMNPDGKNKAYFARGLRNAVGLRWINGRLYATNMGSDHLGDNRPADTFLRSRRQKTLRLALLFSSGRADLSRSEIQYDGDQIRLSQGTGGAHALSCAQLATRFGILRFKKLFRLGRIFSGGTAWIDKKEPAAGL
jgi:hypothetical protein